MYRCTHNTLDASLPARGFLACPKKAIRTYLALFVPTLPTLEHPSKEHLDDSCQPILTYSSLSSPALSSITKFKLEDKMPRLPPLNKTSSLFFEHNFPVSFRVQERKPGRRRGGKNPNPHPSPQFNTLFVPWTLCHDSIISISQALHSLRRLVSILARPLSLAFSSVCVSVSTLAAFHSTGNSSPYSERAAMQSSTPRCWPVIHSLIIHPSFYPSYPIPLHPIPSIPFHPRRRAGVLCSVRCPFPIHPPVSLAFPPPGSRLHPSAICYRLRHARQRAPLPAHSHLNHPSFASPVKFRALHAAHCCCCWELSRSLASRNHSLYTQAQVQTDRHTYTRTHAHTPPPPHPKGETGRKLSL
ncbi:hypothetical protein K456DRAFT_357642 [Colletotrichum gloeosporioides 23]|nr:hypothetical protein K456DRAFT_357642 [Colletotrichum gloeosporioides 23]